MSDLISRTVIDEIAAERLRQIEQEGWTPDRDYHVHCHGEMARAAGCYALFAGGFKEMGQDDDGSPWSKPQQFPWAAEWWKPKDKRRDLIRAAALIVAEIERLDRLRALSTATRNPEKE